MNAHAPRPWLRPVIAATVLALGGIIASALPAPAQEAGSAPAASALPGTRVAQIFIDGSSGAGGPGFGGPSFNPNTSGNFAQFPGGRQGGAIGGGVFGLNAGQTIQMAAFCTDLLSDPPDGRTRFTGGDAAQVAFANGQRMTLASAVQEGLLAVRGHNNSYDPLRRDGTLALDLYLGNLSGVPARVSFAPGTQITPAGQAAQPLPPGGDRLFLEAQRRRLPTNTIQYAVWAARGNTAEEVEQTQMVSLRPDELKTVQEVLDTAGIQRQFDRDRGAYERRYAKAERALTGQLTGIEGTTVLPNGVRADIGGVRTEDGKGVVTVKPMRGGGEFFYTAEFTDRKDGRVNVKLLHLATARAIHANRGAFVLAPKA